MIQVQGEEKSLDILLSNPLNPTFKLKLSSVGYNGLQVDNVNERLQEQFREEILIISRLKYQS